MVPYSAHSPGTSEKNRVDRACVTRAAPPSLCAAVGRGRRHLARPAPPPNLWGASLCARGGGCTQRPGWVGARGAGRGLRKGCLKTATIPAGWKTSGRSCALSGSLGISSGFRWLRAKARALVNNPLLLPAPWRRT